MANRLFKKVSSLVQLNNVRYSYTPRKGNKMRGKPYDEARNLKQRLEEMNYKDPALYFKVDIGLPRDMKQLSKLNSSWLKEASKNRRNREMEIQALQRELKVDIDQVKKDWYASIAPEHLKTIAEHYGIFNDLYGDAYFYPTIPLKINYDFGNEEYLAEVYNGNVLKPREVKNKPLVNFDAPSDTFWTLQMTTPDGNLSDSDKEYCHWLVTNIPGNAIEKGEQLVDYMMPIPCRGIGFCRYIFVLYKQNKKMDFSEYKKEQPCLELTQRNWNTYDFYRKHQDDITPAGLAFFQSDWDFSVMNFYHNMLQMREPVFEYDFPAPYIRPEDWFPKSQPFDTYLDRYRDPKEINKEFLLNKLKKTHPFNGPEPKLRYPNAQFIDNSKVPSWLKERMTWERLGWGRVNDIE